MPGARRLAGHNALGSFELDRDLSIQDLWTVYVCQDNGQPATIQRGSPDGNPPGIGQVDCPRKPLVAWAYQHPLSGIRTRDSAATRSGTLLTITFHIRSWLTLKYS